MTFPVVFGSVLQRDEYDFSNTLVRSTVNHYLWQDNATYKINNFISLPVSSTLKDGAGNQVAQTTYTYDQGTPASSGIGTPTHVAPPGGQIAANGRARSNHWLNTTKNGTAVPLVGSGSERELENGPVAPLRKATDPPPAADLPLICTLTVEPVAPEALVIRIRQGDGVHDTNRARASTLLFIANSTIINPSCKVFDSGAVGVFKIPAVRQRVVKLGSATLQEIKRYLHLVPCDQGCEPNAGSFRPVNLVGSSPWRGHRGDQKHGLPLRQIAWPVPGLSISA